MNSLHEAQLRKDINDSYSCKTEHWMKTNYNENVSGYWKLPNGNCIVKMKKDDGLDDVCDFKNSLPGNLRVFILRNSKRYMYNFIREINGFYSYNIYFTDTDSIYNEKKFRDVLDKAKLVGEELFQGKNDSKSGAILFCFSHRK